MGDRLTTVKNIIWVLLIIVCIVAVLFGILYTMFQQYNGAKSEFSLTLGPSEMASGKNDEIIGDEFMGTSNNSLGNERGELKTLTDLGEAANESYLSDDSIKFLIDSTFIGLRTKSLIGTNQVWGTQSGSMPIGSVNEALIKFPNDGSEISPVDAAMIAKPRVLYIGIGTDGLTNVDKDTFIRQYDTLIENIRNASPDTIIVCMGLCSVTESYSGPDGLNITVMSDGNDYVQLVCRDTGAYYLDVSENLGDGSGGLRASYAEANGKSLNTQGLGIVMQYVKSHGIN